MESNNLISFKDFYNDYLVEQEDFSFLCGNGLGLSNPGIKHLFDFDISSVKRVLTHELREYYLDKNYTCPEIMLADCPEVLLGEFREELMGAILMSYSSKLKENLGLIHHYRDSLSEFIKNFKSLYTLNYDGLIYQAVIAELISEYSSKHFRDGIFGGDKYVLEASVIDNLSYNKNGHIRLFYPHGSLHIFSNHNESMPMLKKIPATDIQEKIENSELPLIVMAGREDLKEVQIKKSRYLQYCLETLAKEKSVFVFGCSFEKDAHILIKLLKNISEKRLFISCHTINLIPKIEEIAAKHGLSEALKNITWVDVSGEENEAVVKAKIWGL